MLHTEGRRGKVTQGRDEWLLFVVSYLDGITELRNGLGWKEP